MDEKFDFYSNNFRGVLNRLSVKSKNQRWALFRPKIFKAKRISQPPSAKPTPPKEQPLLQIIKKSVSKPKSNNFMLKLRLLMAKNKKKPKKILKNRKKKKKRVLNKTARI